MLRATSASWYIEALFTTEADAMCIWKCCCSYRTPVHPIRPSVSATTTTVTLVSARQFGSVSTTPSHSPILGSAPSPDAKAQPKPLDLDKGKPEAQSPPVVQSHMPILRPKLVSYPPSLSPVREVTDESLSSTSPTPIKPKAAISQNRWNSAPR